MKRLLLLILACALLAVLTACGGQETAAPAADSADTAGEPAAEPAEAPAEPATVEEQIALVQSLIDEPIDRLYEAIDYPADSAYASSCLGEGEDGELYYDGFTVYTYRDTDGSETVYDVMPTETESGQ